MSLKRVVSVDETGRKRIVLIPEEDDESEADKGIVVGPPPLDTLGLPEEIEVRLNNELFNRNIFTVKDALSRRSEVLLALQSALKVDAGKIVDIYMGEDYKVARREQIEAVEAKQPMIAARRRRR